MKYYEKEKDRDYKKSLELKNSQVFIEEQNDFQQNRKRSGKSDSRDDWTEPNQIYRVGIKLTGREMKPIYFYSKDLHDAKFLLVNISFHANQQQAAALTGMIEMANQIEKA